MATMVSTGLTLEPSSAPPARAPPASAGRSPVGGAEQAVGAALQRRLGRDQLQPAHRLRAAVAHGGADGAVAGDLHRALAGSVIGPPSPSTGRPAA
jgi:hypothetical protein